MRKLGLFTILATIVVIFNGCSSSDLTSANLNKVNTSIKGGVPIGTYGWLNVQVLENNEAIDEGFEISVQRGYKNRGRIIWYTSIDKFYTDRLGYVIVPFSSKTDVYKLKGKSDGHWSSVFETDGNTSGWLDVIFYFNGGPVYDKDKTYKTKCPGTSTNIGR
jgi:hypothetical protein